MRSRYGALLCGLVCLLASEGIAEVIEFSGLKWDVKSGCGLGPGPNCWSDASESVWVDILGRLHLKIRQEDGVWYSAEVSTQESFGFGDYRFEVIGQTELFDPDVIAGLFTFKWRGTELPPHEIDIELTRFGRADRTDTAQYTVQPFDAPGNLFMFPLGLGGTHSTHRFTWGPDSIFFQSIHGLHDTPPTPAHEIASWT